MPKQCAGQTRNGKRCSITACCTLVNTNGRLLAEPLQRGGEYCRIHAKPFCTNSVTTERPVVTVFLDLETSGTDVTKDRIVELAATHVPNQWNAMGSNFSTTVCVPPAVLEESQDAALVHGIPDEEIIQGPLFPEAWSRFLHWVDALLNYAVVEEGASDSDVEEGSLPQIHDHPILLLAGHNSIGFDFPFLLCEAIRHSLSTAPFADWVYVDTLHI